MSAMLIVILALGGLCLFALGLITGLLWAAHEIEKAVRRD